MAEIGLFEAMYSARGLSRVRPDPVPDEIIAKILDAAIRAPSASNDQHWAFVVVKDPERRRRVAQVYRKVAEGIRPLLEKLYEQPQARAARPDRSLRILG